MCVSFFSALVFGAAGSRGCLRVFRLSPVWWNVGVAIAKGSCGVVVKRCVGLAGCDRERRGLRSWLPCYKFSSWQLLLRTQAHWLQGCGNCSFATVAAATFTSLSKCGAPLFWRFLTRPGWLFGLALLQIPPRRSKRRLPDGYLVPLEEATWNTLAGAASTQKVGEAPGASPTPTMGRVRGLTLSTFAMLSRR